MLMRSCSVSAQMNDLIHAGVVRSRVTQDCTLGKDARLKIPFVEWLVTYSIAVIEDTSPDITAAQANGKGFAKGRVNAFNGLPQGARNECCFSLSSHLIYI